MATTTIYTNFSALLLRDDEAVLVVKLMMAFNDLAVANEGLASHKTKLAMKRTEKDRGVAMYFVRLQASHLYEAMKIIDAINKSERLMQVISNCTEKCQEAFGRLIAIRNDKVQAAKFEKFVGRLRNSLTFHYDQSGKLVKRAMTRRSSNRFGNPTSITIGTDPYSWRFTIADDIVDTVVCREIWGIPDSSNDLQEEADSAVNYGHSVFIDFMDFVADFVVRYIRHRA